MLAGITDCRSQKWGSEEDWRWDLNTGAAAIPGGEDQGALAEWRPCGGDTADHARSLNHGLLLLFLRYGTLDRAEEEGRTVCICGYSKGL